MAEPILTHGGRAMEEYSEAFVAFDVAKRKHALAIAEGGRAGRSAPLVTTAWWLRRL